MAGQAAKLHRETLKQQQQINKKENKLMNSKKYSIYKRKFTSNRKYKILTTLMNSVPFLYYASHCFYKKYYFVMCMSRSLGNSKPCVCGCLWSPKEGVGATRR